MDAQRILFVAPVLPPYRAPEADHALQECLHLASRGFDVHVLTKQHFDLADPPGITVHTVKSWSWADLFNVMRIIHTVRPTAGLIFFLGHLYSYKKMPLLIPLIIKLFRPDAKIASQFSNLGTGAPKGDKLQQRASRLLFRALGKWRYGSILPLSRTILLMSDRHIQSLKDASPELESLARLCPPPPLIDYRADDSELRKAARAKFGIPSDAFVFGYFSRLYPRKGIEELLDSFADLATELHDIHLLFIGGFHSADAWFQANDYPDQLESRLSKLDVAARVHWTGEFSWEGLAASSYLNAVDAAVLPFYSGVHLHNSSFAAVAAHKLPVIATEPRAHPDPHVRNGVEALLVQPRDSIELRGAMRRVHNDDKLREKLASGSAKLAEQWFNWDTCTDTILEALDLRIPSHLGLVNRD